MSQEGSPKSGIEYAGNGSPSAHTRGVPGGESQEGIEYAGKGLARVPEDVPAVLACVVVVLLTYRAWCSCKRVIHEGVYEFGGGECHGETVDPS